MKKKFNFKLTAFLVSLFVSLLIIILGNKNPYCLCFGFILMAISMVLYVLYNNEKTETTIEQINLEIDQMGEFDEIEDIESDERIYIVQQLYIRQGKLLKRKKSISIMFYLFAGLLVVLAVFGIF
ncbi:MAG: hypothetical protein IJ415_03495 [Clostridia bacterium]|nr:hypothetical protein [Clostridia bacterium]